MASSLRWSCSLLLIAVSSSALATEYLDQLSVDAACEEERARQEAIGNTAICGDFDNYAPCTCELVTTNAPNCYIELRYPTENGIGPGGFAGDFYCPSPVKAESLIGQDPTCPPDGSALDDRCANPIQISIGNKFQIERDFDGPGLLDFVRYYNSHPAAPSASLGPRWSHTYSTHVEVTSGGTLATVHLSHGRQISFALVSTTWQAPAGSFARLIEIKNGGGVRTGWHYIEQDERRVDEFDAEGRLAFIRRVDGQELTLVHNYGLDTTAEENRLVTSVTDQSGRSLNFDYDTNHRLIEMIDAGGIVHDFTYDAEDRLETAGVTVASVRTFREYKYNESSLTSGRHMPYALTGIIDENSDRFANFGYASNGMAVLSEHAGGAERFEITHNVFAGTSEVTTPGGVTQERETEIINGVPRVTSVTESCTGCTTRTREYTYDTAGRVDQKTDASGVITDFDYDSSGRLETLVEGLVVTGPPACPAGSTFYGADYGTGCGASSCWATSPFPGSISAAPIGYSGWYVSCPVDPTTYVRKTETTWESDFHLPAETKVYDFADNLVAETDWTYNAGEQVLTVTQTDPVTSATRTTTYDYCDATDVATTNSTCPILGLLKSIDGPLAGSGDTTTFLYRSDEELESPRLSRRLHPLRGWSHETEKILPGVARAGRANAVRARVRVPIAVGGDPVDRRQGRVFGRGAA